MHTFKALVSALAACAVISFGLAGLLWPMHAQSHTAPAVAPRAYVQRPALCKREAARRPMVSHDIGQSGLTWQYVDRGEAREFHISPCSIVLAGNGQSAIVTPTGRIVTTS